MGEGVLKREQRKLEREEKAKQNFQAKNDHVAMMLYYHEQIKERMEADEVLLIEKLQVTQRLQRAAYDDLERIMIGDQVEPTSFMFQDPTALQMGTYAQDED